MSGYGINWKIGRYLNPTYYALGGTVLEASLDPRVTVHEEAGSGQRQLASQKAVEAKPTLEWTQNIRRLADYINAYCMPTAEGAIPAHTLHVTDGIEPHELGGVKVNSCMITIKVSDSIKAKISAMIKTHTTASIGTFSEATEAAMYKNAVTSVTLGGGALTQWQQIEFGVDNKVLQETLGNQLMPAEVQEQEALYTMRITRAMNTASRFGLALAGTSQTFVIALTDNQSNPVTKTYTFADMYLTTARKEDRALGLIMEKIEGKGKSLVIT